MAYTPWIENTVNNIVLKMLAILFPAAGAWLFFTFYIKGAHIAITGIAIEQNDWLWISPLFVAAGAICWQMSKNNLKQRKARKYGVKVEDASVKAALKLNWGEWNVWVDDHSYKGVGNIDLLARSPRGIIYTIEIKSWHYTRIDKEGFLCGKKGRFGKDPLAQATRQANFVARKTGYRVTPILWMPKSKRWIESSRGVYIIKGSPRVLIGYLNEIDKEE